MPAALQLGSIVWAEIADANGLYKLRPTVVITPTDRISQDQPLHVVAVTSRLSEPLPSDHVLLPWHAGGHARTGLNRRCAAVCTWAARIQLSDVKEIGGIVPGGVMVEILRKIAGAAPAENPKN
jgi:hypothetical protein